MEHKINGPVITKKPAISDKDRKIIKTQIEADFDKIKTGEKRAINLGSKNSYYLPPPSVLFNLLGFRFDLAKIFAKFESLGVKPPTISRSSLYNLQGKGVGKSTYKKYIDWAIGAPLPLLNNLIEGKNPQLDASFKLSSNAYLWLASFESIKSAITRNNNELRHEYFALIEFIQYRCDTEIAFQQYLHEQGQYSESELSNSNIEWTLFLKPFLAQHTVLTLTILDSMDIFMANREFPPCLPEEGKNILYENALRLKFDFILTAIAHYEIGYILTFPPTKLQPQIVTPLACQSIKRYVISDEYRTCFYWALKILKDWWSITKPDISWREIARYIPVENTDPTCESGTVYTDKQYSRLKDWRKGKNLPSNELLALFIRNITGKLEMVTNNDSLFILCRITMGLDKILTNLIKQSKQTLGAENQVRCIWKDVLSHYYEDYYLHYLNQYTAKTKETT